MVLERLVVPGMVLVPALDAINLQRMNCHSLFMSYWYQVVSYLVPGTVPVPGKGVRSTTRYHRSASFMVPSFPSIFVNRSIVTGTWSVSSQNNDVLGGTTVPGRH